MGGSETRYRFRPVEELFDQEISLGHHPSSPQGQPKEEAGPKTALQEKDILSKILDVCHEVKGTSWLQIPTRLP